MEARASIPTIDKARSVSENSSLVLLNSLEKERKGVRIIRNHGENLPISYLPEQRD